MNMTTLQLKPYADDHLHSRHGSFDAESSLLELAKTAINKGLARICVTEHLDFECDLPEYGFFNYEICHRAIEDTREKFSGQLEIAFGLEVDFDSHNLKEIAETLRTMAVDFILGSVHSYPGGYFHEIRHSSSPLSENELSRLYNHYFYEHQIMIKEGLVDAVAHLDYPALIGVRSFDSIPPPGYEEAMNNTIDLAVFHKIALEINTRNALINQRNTAATEKVVTQYVALGGRFLTLGSDAHHADKLGNGLEIGLNIIHRAGLPEQTIYRKRRPWQPD